MVSPGSAPATNAVLPARTTPSPSCVRAATLPTSSSPGMQEFREMGLLAGAQQVSHLLHLLRVALGSEAPAHEIEAQIHQVGVEDVRLAIAANAHQITRQPFSPDLRAGEP